MPLYQWLHPSRKLSLLLEPEGTNSAGQIEFIAGEFPGIELSDFAFAIRRGDVEGTDRFLQRFPALRESADEHGIPFKLLAQQSGDPAIARLFQSETNA